MPQVPPSGDVKPQHHKKPQPQQPQQHPAGNGGGGGGGSHGGGSGGGGGNGGGGHPHNGHFTIDQFLAGLRQTEHGVYDWVNNGSGAYGAYQIMSNNWPVWAHEAGVNPNDHSQHAQDAVARLQVQKYWNKYHDWNKVAASWYYPARAGDPSSWDWTPPGNHITIGGYVDRVMSNAGAPQSARAGGGGGAGAGDGAGNGNGGNDGGGGGLTLDERQLYREYGSIATLLKDTKLQKLVSQAVAGGWDDNKFTHKLYDTDFYKKHSDAQRNWLLLWNGPDRGEGHAELQKQMHTIRDQAATMGVALSRKELHDLAWQSLLNGFDPNQLSEAIGGHYEMRQNIHSQGQAGSLEDQYRQLADQYGLPMSDFTLQQLVHQSLTGKLDANGVHAQLQDQAVGLYPGLEKELRAGRTITDISQPYVDQMASLLELDPQTLSWRNKTIGKALNAPSNDPSKPPGVTPIWQFQQQLRDDPRWLKTQNAQDSLMDVGTNLLRQFGVMT